MTFDFWCLIHFIVIFLNIVKVLQCCGPWWQQHIDDDDYRRWRRECFNYSLRHRCNQRLRPHCWSRSWHRWDVTDWSDVEVNRPKKITFLSPSFCSAQWFATKGFVHVITDNFPDIFCRTDCENFTDFFPWYEMTTTLGAIHLLRRLFRTILGPSCPPPPHM